VLLVLPLLLLPQWLWVVSGVAVFRRESSRPIPEKEEDDGTENDEWVERGALPDGRNLLLLPIPMRVDEEEL
jgi:hypothetical protein